MAEGNVIGEYLRARRELLRPEDVGLPDVDRRHVPGLRRSELAMLAGISTAETGRKSEEAVAMLAATMGEPNAPPLHDAPVRRAQTS
jgi:hypothetical protein